MFNKSTWLVCLFTVNLLHVEIGRNAVPVPVHGQAFYLTLSASQVESHTLSCTLDARLSSMNKVTSLTLYCSRTYGQAGEFDALAHVDLWNPQAKLLNSLDDSDVEFFGMLSTTDDIKSKLAISWASRLNSTSVWLTA